jgi:hypothetical protein
MTMKENIPRLFRGRDGGLWEWPDSSCHSLVGGFKIEFFFSHYEGKHERWVSQLLLAAQAQYEQSIASLSFHQNQCGKKERQRLTPIFHWEYNFLEKKEKRKKGKEKIEKKEKEGKNIETF